MKHEVFAQTSTCISSKQTDSLKILSYVLISRVFSYLTKTGHLKT